MLSASDHLQKHPELVTKKNMDMLRGIGGLPQDQKNYKLLKELANQLDVPNGVRKNFVILRSFLERLQGTIHAGVSLQESGFKVGDKVTHATHLTWKEPDEITRICKDFTIRVKNHTGAFKASNLRKS